jgi:hypothetical protein
MTDLPNKRYFRPDEVARILEQPLRTVYYWLENDKIKHLHLGRKTVVPRGNTEGFGVWSVKQENHKMRAKAKVRRKRVGRLVENGMSLSEVRQELGINRNIVVKDFVFIFSRIRHRRRLGFMPQLQIPKANKSLIESGISLSVMASIET